MLSLSAMKYERYSVSCLAQDCGISLLCIVQGGIFFRRDDSVNSISSGGFAM